MTRFLCSTAIVASVATMVGMAAFRVTCHVPYIALTLTAAFFTFVNLTHPSTRA